MNGPFNFGQALDAMKKGYSVRRIGWRAHEYVLLLSEDHVLVFIRWVNGHNGGEWHDGRVPTEELVAEDWMIYNG